MALQFARGTLLWPGADAVNTTYTISGLPFQPKALRFYVLGRASATDATASTHLRQCVGFAVSTSSRRAVATYDQHASGTMICTSGYRDDCVVLTVDGSPAASGRLDLNSIASDGFQLIVDDQAPADVMVFWEAWGGSEITVAAVVDIAEPSATGNVDYTVTGFTNGATDQVVMFAGTQTTGASPSAVRTDGGICMGFASGPDAANNIVMAGNQDDGSTTSDTDRYIRDGECVAMIALAGGNPNARAQLTQFGTNNFRLNWAAVGTTDRRYIALAIKGGKWVVGSTTINATSASATATVSGLPFAPIGVSLMSGFSTEDAAGTSSVEDKKSMGSGSSTSSRAAQGCWDENGPTTSDVNVTVEYDGILAVPTASATIDCVIDLSQMNSDGFQLIVDDAGASVSSTSWVGYLAFGTVPTRGRVSFAELETPNVQTRGRVSFVELEVPNVATRGRVSWAEFEVPTTQTRGRVSFAELEVPSFALTPTRGQVSWVELETPFVATRGRVSWIELETPFTPTRGRVSFAELETPNVATRGRVSFLELEVGFAPTRGRISFAEFEAPAAPTRGRVSWMELQVPDVGAAEFVSGRLRRRRR